MALDDDDDDDDQGTDGVTDDATTEFAATQTANDDRDATRGDDGTNGAATVTSNRDGDDTRSNDGTDAGDGGTVTRNRDGDGTRGNDGTNGGATVTSNTDGDDTRGDDGPTKAPSSEGAFSFARAAASGEGRAAAGWVRPAPRSPARAATPHPSRPRGSDRPEDAPTARSGPWR